MECLVGDLLDIASIQTGLLKVTFEAADAVVVANEALDNFQVQATANGIALLLETEASSVFTHFDPGRILQVLANLLSNAMKFTPRGGRVVLRVETIENEVLFSVIDTGPGIPEDQLKEVFGRFVQLGNSPARSVGLGLYISNCIVKAHGGRIWANSEIGAGSTLSFALPIDTAEGARPAWSPSRA